MSERAKSEPEASARAAARRCGAGSARGLRKTPLALWYRADSPGEARLELLDDTAEPVIEARQCLAADQLRHTTVVRLGNNRRLCRWSRACGYSARNAG